MKKQLSKQSTNTPFGGFRGLLALLLFPLWGVGGLYATVTVTPISADYANQKVTFKVAWTGTAANNRVWVWVDLCPVAGTSPGTFAKAVISAASATAGSIDAASLNGRGFYVTANPSTVTATLSNATGKFNWCAYGSDYPPNARNNGSSYTLKGSKPFVITTTGGTVELNDNIYSGGTITAITDATGCPGVLCGKNGDVAGLLNCCVPGTTNCSGTCTSNSTYQSQGNCTGTCNERYQHNYNQCGFVNTTTITDNSCLEGCSPDCASCKQLCDADGYSYAYLVDEPWSCKCANAACSKTVQCDPLYGLYQWTDGGWKYYNSPWGYCSKCHRCQ